jgi:hypothetical protein
MYQHAGPASVTVAVMLSSLMQQKQFVYVKLFRFFLFFPPRPVFRKESLIPRRYITAALNFVRGKGKAFA